MLGKKKKLRYLRRHYGFSDVELIEIGKFYDGQPFDDSDKGFLRLRSLSEELCKSYSFVYKTLQNRPSLMALAVNYFKRAKLLKKIFLGSKLSADIRPDFHCLIGQVDLAGTCFLNQGLVCAPTCHVVVAKDAVLSPNVVLGDSSFGRISIGRSVWLGASSRLKTNVMVGDNSIVAAGAYLENDVMADSVALGRPASTKPLVLTPKRPKLTGSYSETEIAELRKRLADLGFKSAIKDYLKILRGETVNVGHPSIGRLFLYSHSLSYEYSDSATSESRKKEILDLLFPLGHENLVTGQTVYVDLLGLVRLGKNVTLGDGVSFYGRSLIGDGAKIGKQVSLIASGHPLDPKERRFRFSLIKGFVSLSGFSYLEVGKDVSVGEGAIITPDSKVESDIPPHAIMASGGRLII